MRDFAAGQGILTFFLMTVVFDGVEHVFPQVWGHEELWGAMHRAPQKSGGGNPMVSSLLVGGGWWNERAYVGGWAGGWTEKN